MVGMGSTLRVAAAAPPPRGNPATGRRTASPGWRRGWAGAGQQYVAAMLLECGYLDTWQKILWPQQDQGQCEASEAASPPLSLLLRILPNIGHRGDVPIFKSLH